MNRSVDVIDLAKISGGFEDPVQDSQRCFRQMLRALSSPGSIVECGVKPPPPAGLCSASTALLLALLDSDCAVWISPGAGSSGLADFFRFHTGCTSASSMAVANFALIRNELELPRLANFNWGSDEYPDRSVSLILQVEHLREGGPWQLTGPGIERSRSVCAGNLPLWFIGDWASLHASFPRGFEVFLCADNKIMALSRTTRLSLQSDTCTSR